MAVQPAPSGLITYEEFLAVTGEDEHAEWVNGEIIPMSPVSDRHQAVSLFLVRIIADFVEANELGVIRYESFQMKTGPELPGREPDILFVSNENLSRLKRNYLDGPADLVVEVTSPESLIRDRSEKFIEYEKGGVREYWLIDPLRQIAEFHVRGGDNLYHSSAVIDGVYRSQVLRGLWLRVDWLWQDPLPKARQVIKEWGLTS